MAYEFNVDDQYADVPPPGYEYIAWNGYSLKDGDMVFTYPCGPWKVVQPGMNLIGATLRELHGVLGAAAPAKRVEAAFADVPLGTYYNLAPVGGAWQVKTAETQLPKRNKPVFVQARCPH